MTTSLWRGAQAEQFVGQNLHASTPLAGGRSSPIQQCQHWEHDDHDLREYSFHRRVDPASAFPFDPDLLHPFLCQGEEDLNTVPSQTLPQRFKARIGMYSPHDSGLHIHLLKRLLRPIPRPHTRH